MAIVQQLEEAIELAKAQGILVRTECLDETPGGLCRVGDKQYIYLDLADSPAEQLQIVSAALASLNGQSDQRTDRTGSNRQAA